MLYYPHCRPVLFNEVNHQKGRQSEFLWHVQQFHFTDPHKNRLHTSLGYTSVAPTHNRPHTGVQLNSYHTSSHLVINTSNMNKLVCMNKKNNPLKQWGERDVDSDNGEIQSTWLHG